MVCLIEYTFTMLYPWVYQGKRLTCPTLMHTTKLMIFLLGKGKEGPERKKLISG
jgi:hypothetical protein